jgi:hypothetical protein
VPLAAIRADEINFPLLLHVFGAMVLMGMLFAGALALVLAWTRADAAGAVSLTRFGLWSMVAGALPGWVLMRLGAQWTASKEFPGSEPDLTWLGVGYTTADLGGLILLVSVVLSVIGLRRTRTDAAASPRTLGRVVGAAALLLLLAYLVAIWAMTTKPT